MMTWCWVYVGYMLPRSDLPGPTTATKILRQKPLEQSEMLCILKQARKSGSIETKSFFFMTASPGSRAMSHKQAVKKVMHKSRTDRYSWCFKKSWIFKKNLRRENMENWKEHGEVKMIWIWRWYELIWRCEIIEGSLEAILPTIWTVEKQRWEESEEKRSEERRCRCVKR